MEEFQAVLLKVWREACRHIAIDESAETIAPMLLDVIPVDQLLVRRIDRQRSWVETIAAGLPGPARLHPEARSECSASQLRKLLAWCRRGEIGQRAKQGSFQGDWEAAVPPGIDEDVLVGPLTEGGGPSGVLVLIAQPRRTFNARHKALTRVLLDPFSAALANDRQLRELATLREAAEAERQSLLVRLGRDKSGDTIVGAGSGLRAVMERVALVAGSDVPVLIFGDTGTGKELIARAIHSGSPRSSGPINRVNCGAIPPELIDSELFGHERGAFTGAMEARKGWFERADGGTLFLDEIGELPLAAQVRLLRIVQDGWLERVGGEHRIRVDVRIVAATHRDLAKMVAEGKFREDLWYRISVFPIVLPRLSERTEDIPELAEHFARRAAKRFGLPLAMPSPDDIRLLMSYPWPGNVRELATVIDRAAILGDGKCLAVAQALGVSTAMPASTAGPDKPRPAPQVLPDQVAPLDDAMRLHIQAALSAAKGRIEGPFGAANRLKINPHTLRARMRKLGIDWKRFRQKSTSPNTGSQP
jgi:transcriptional regulator with GAF, ATPase, and Fis domain